MLRTRIFTNPVTEESSFSPLAKDFDWSIWIGLRPGVRDTAGSTAIDAKQAGLADTDTQVATGLIPGGQYNRNPCRETALGSSLSCYMPGYGTRRPDVAEPLEGPRCTG